MRVQADANRRASRVPELLRASHAEFCLGAANRRPVGWQLIAPAAGLKRFQ